MYPPVLAVIWSIPWRVVNLSRMTVPPLATLKLEVSGWSSLQLVKLDKSTTLLFPSA